MIWEILGSLVISILIVSLVNWWLSSKFHTKYSAISNELGRKFSIPFLIIIAIYGILLYWEIIIYGIIGIFVLIFYILVSPLFWIILVTLIIISLLAQIASNTSH